ncbi:MAG: 4Fe-4S dicluster domain-containing protein [Desulfatirhabdiaceae bacterium]
MNIVCVETARCIACLSCQRVCFFHQNEVNHCHTANIRVHVDMEKRRILTTTCRQCEKAECMSVCPPEAITRDQVTGVVIIDKSICIGCGLCVAACPYGAVQLDDIQQVATKCDLCGGRPICVDVCMARALHFCSVEAFVEMNREQKDLKFGIRAVPMETDGHDDG